MKRRAFYVSLGAVLVLLVFALLILMIGEFITRGDPTPSLDLEEALEGAANFSGGNADWTPVNQEFDGVKMVLVPAGCFQMGSENGDDDEKPVHQVCFEEPFWIDKYEVTNGQFAAFNGQAAKASHRSDDNHPREQITWTEAAAFCESRGVRLPTEAEWEYAARGPDGWVYPWGNAWEPDKVVWDGNSNDQTANVGSRSAGISWAGALDLSGNVFEWVADWYGPYPEGSQVNPQGPASGDARVLRGGSWYVTDLDFFRAVYRDRVDPLYLDADIGFRCARSMDMNSTLPINPETAALPAGAHNADWTPVIQEFEGVEMVRVPAGCFQMGSEDGEDDEIPVHEVCFEEPFWIDQTEVTNGQFASFNGQAVNASYYSGDDRPRDQITWTEAAAFCESRGARLPTEAEWEYAARGPDGWVYPWGNEWEESRVIGFRSYSEGTAPVGSIPAGASWVGALDLSGNIWEWVADWYGAYPDDPQVNPQGPDSGEYRVLRGGSWAVGIPDFFRATYRYRNLPDYGSNIMSFRCARSE